MSLSRNVNLDKMSACHEGHEGSADCTIMRGREGLSIIMERSIIEGGQILVMGGQWI